MGKETGNAKGPVLTIDNAKAAVPLTTNQSYDELNSRSKTVPRRGFRRDGRRYRTAKGWLGAGSAQLRMRSQSE